MPSELRDLEILCERPTIASPIWPILCAAPATLVTGAPERRGELTDSLHGVTLHLSDSPACEAWSSSPEKTIGVSRGMAECLWCASYAYYVFRREVEALARKPSDTGGLLLEIGEKESVRLALAVLKRGMTAAVGGEAVDWEGLPLPVPPAPISRESSLPALAGEMTLAALAFVLHHELAHIRLGHVAEASAPDWTMEQEKDADGEAIDWLLSDQDVPIGKRAAGIVFATSFLTAKRLEMLGPKTEPTPIELQSHPLPFERLNAAVQLDAVQQVPNLRLTLESLACATLIPHLRLKGIALDRGPYADYHALYEHCLDQLSSVLVK